MRIGIDTFSFDKPGTNYGVGPGVYVRRLLPEIFRNAPQHQFVVFANRENEELVPAFPNVRVVVSPFQNRFRPYRVMHEQVFIPIQAVSRRLDLVHFLGNNISYAIASRSVLTVHDLMWKYYLDLGYSDRKYRYFALTVPRSLEKARAVITVSQYVAKEISGQYRRSSTHVFPIHEASGNASAAPRGQTSALERKYDVPFIFAVTTSMPHKNLLFLLRAFKILKDRNLFSGKLIVAGQLKDSFHKATTDFVTANRLEQSIILAGFVSEEEKAVCYRDCLFFVYPSLYEGFGLPVLEAMEAGVPVLASNAASIPEVGGDACAYFSPTNLDELVNAMSDLIEHPARRDELVRRGLRRHKAFTWTKTAVETLAVYEKVHALRSRKG